MKVITDSIAEFTDTSLCEIYQSVDWQFAFLSPDGKQCYSFVKCRDFLHDIARASLTEKPISIYRCTYNGKTDPKVNFEQMNMLVRVCLANDKNVGDYDELMNYALRLINHYEHMAGEKTSSTVARLETSKKGMMWLFTGPKFWMSSPFFISLFSFLIRMGSKKLDFKDEDSLHKEFKRILGTIEDNDTGYLRSIHARLNELMKKPELVRGKDAIDKGFFVDVNIETFHSRGGIVSLVTAQSFSKIKNKRIKEIFGAKK